VNILMRCKKQVLAGIALGMTVFIGGCSDSDPVTLPEQSPVSESTSNPATAKADPVKQALGQKVVEFEHKLYDIERQTADISQLAGEEMQAIVSRTPNFDIMQKAVLTYLDVAVQYRNVPIPEGLSPEHQKILKESLEDYASAFEAKARAVDDVMQYTLTKNDKAAYKSLEETQLAEKLVHRAVAAVILVEVDLGVDFTQKEDYKTDGQPAPVTATPTVSPSQAPVASLAPVPNAPAGALGSRLLLPETVLQKGAKGAAVKTLQEALLRVGEALPGGADGAFGDGTAEALKSFQRKKGLGADGIYGAATQRELQTALGSSVLTIWNGHIAIKGVYRGMKEADVTGLYGQPRQVETAGYYDKSFNYNLLSVGFYDGEAEGITYMTDTTILQDPFLVNFPGEKYAGKDGQIAVYYLPGTQEQLFFKEEEGAFRAYITQDDNNFKFQIEKGTFTRVK